MKNKFLWWIVKICIFTIDKDDSLLVHSFAKDETTEYHVMAERCYPDKHCFGTRVDYYSAETIQTLDLIEIIL